MLAKDLSKADIGNTIYFSGGINFSNTAYEFRAMFLGITSYDIYIEADFSFQKHVDDSIVLSHLSNQMLSRSIMLSIDEIYYRLNGEIEWKPVKSYSKFERLQYNAIISINSN